MGLFVSDLKATFRKDLFVLLFLLTKMAEGGAGQMDINEALKEVVKKALIHDGLARGLNEARKALEGKNAKLCLLANSCNEQQYTRLIEALCQEGGVTLLKNFGDGKQLGEWCGLCKIDAEGMARKVVNCSCAVITDYGEESEAFHVIQNHIKSNE